jgi:uncharacterized phage-associated protein
LAYDARAVANTVLDLAEEEALCLTHMAVHKVLFYAHAWHLAEHDRPLVKQPFEAWQHGPVLRCVWDTLKVNGSSPVRTRATRHDLVTDQCLVVPGIDDGADREFLRGIVRAYGHLHAFELSDMTHEAGGAWDRVFNDPLRRVNLGMRIDNTAIKQHFHAVTVRDGGPTSRPRQRRNVPNLM